MKSLRLLLLTAAGGALVLSAAVPVSAAYAAGPKQAAAPSGLHHSDPVIDAFIHSAGAGAIRNQDALSTFRGWMFGLPGFASSGYVGTIDDVAHKATTVMWAGPRTPLLAAILREGARRGIAVTVQPRKYSLQQLDAATNAIWKQAAQGQWSGFRIATIAEVATGYDGIVVNGTYTSGPLARRAPQVQSLATVTDGVPVRVTPGVAAVPFNGRDNDFAPFDAGGYMISPSTNGTCSTGFAINLNGTSHTITARHCTENDFQARSASNSYGTGVENSGDGGARVLSTTGAALALDGAWNSNGVSKTVIGFEDLGVNDLVCTGGGNSGEHCNIKITNLRVSWNDGIGAFSTIEGIQQSSGAIAAMAGDSGGPVISLTNTSGGQVRAAGMIQTGVTPLLSGSACGPSFDPDNVCSTGVLFSSTRTIVNSISGASLRTG